MATPKVLKISILFLIYVAIATAWVEIDPQPQQIHLSLGASPSAMVVTWITTNSTNHSIVEYGEVDGSSLFPFKKVGYETKFVDGGCEKRSMYVHRVLLQDLRPGHEYYYHCGSDLGWSEEFTFRTIKDGSDWSPRFAVYGDLGNVNGQSIPRLQQEVQRGNFDAILHVGDMAYDLDTDNARVGDEFLRQLQPIAAYLPYQTVVGNHEYAYNFSNYVNRFSMINMRDGQMNNHFYSFDIGPVHFISFSTEFYFFVNYGWQQIANQYRWLDEDLKEATKKENREKRPWIITMGHRPMYCSSNDDLDCTANESIVRKGLPFIHAYGLEDLFYKYGVDIEIWAHEHNYERLWPVYDQKVYNGTVSPYVDPDAPVHITTGSAGCHEELDNFVDHPRNWSAFRLADYGYTRMHVLNKSHIYFEQVSDDQDGKIVDSFTVVKNHHGKYSMSDTIL